MKVEIIIPDGKYCDGCQLFDNGSSYEYSCWCNYIDKSLEAVYDGGFVKKTLKHSKCPSYGEYRMDKYLLSPEEQIIICSGCEKEEDAKDLGKGCINWEYCLLTEQHLKSVKAVFEAVEQDFEDGDTIWQLRIAKFRWDALKKELLEKFDKLEGKNAYRR